MAYDRPNKIRVELLNGRVICNGKQWCGSCAMVPGQEVLRDAPAKISMDILRADYWLYVGLSDAGQITSPQLQLLLDADPIKSLVNGSEDITLDEPGKLGDFDCYRVRFAVPGGAGELGSTRRRLLCGCTCCRCQRRRKRAKRAASPAASGWS